ncbi:CD99 antigen isoform X2 [Dromiciops gliroides]|uniref:CD99 antigen isoform X2 n=1 Tax=Dromiciops gliroides TaxID=33562 RepID=UPI001CC6434B|nr:CD99 antigen isoform X2 [Dromiciops gliroides]
MGRWLAMPLLLVLLVCSLAPARGQDFDLSEALDDETTTKPPPNKKPQPDEPVKPNPPKPKPDHHSDSGYISDDDLGGPSKDSDDRSNDETAPADSPGVIPGIVSAVVVALAGAVSSFIAYQKKKLCFKGNDEPRI